MEKKENELLLERHYSLIDTDLINIILYFLTLLVIIHSKNGDTEEIASVEDFEGFETKSEITDLALSLTDEYWWETLQNIKSLPSECNKHILISLNFWEEECASIEDLKSTITWLKDQQNIKVIELKMTFDPNEDIENQQATVSSFLGLLNELSKDIRYCL